MDALARAAFLEQMEEPLLDGLITDPPPSLVSDYLHHLVQEGLLSQFQSAVARIPIEALDIHLVCVFFVYHLQVMSTCRQNGLYDGIIYVMNKALNDYLSPLEVAAFPN